MVADTSFDEASLAERATKLGLLDGINDLQQLSAQKATRDGAKFITRRNETVNVSSHFMRGLLEQAQAEGVDLPNINAGLELYWADRDTPLFTLRHMQRDLTLDELFLLKPCKFVSDFQNFIGFKIAPTDSPIVFSEHEINQIIAEGETQGRDIASFKKALEMMGDHQPQTTMEDSALEKPGRPAPASPRPTSTPEETSSLWNGIVKPWGLLIFGLIIPLFGAMGVYSVAEKSRPKTVRVKEFPSLAVSTAFNQVAEGGDPCMSPTTTRKVYNIKELTVSDVTCPNNVTRSVTRPMNADDVPAMARARTAWNLARGNSTGSVSEMVTGEETALRVMLTKQGVPSRVATPKAN